MPRPKPINYNPLADLLDRLPAPTIVTRGDKLALLRAFSERAGSVVQAGVNRLILKAIEYDIRAAGRTAAKDNAPVEAEAPSKAESRAELGSEVGSSIATDMLERKITTEDTDLSVRPCTGLVELHLGDLGDSIGLTPDQARRLAAALEAAADDVDRDTAVREHNRALLEATTG